jgi:hypothetical protein
VPLATDIFRKRQNSANLKERPAAIGRQLGGDWQSNGKVINIHSCGNNTFLLGTEILKQLLKGEK